MTLVLNKMLSLSQKFQFSEPTNHEIRTILTLTIQKICSKMWI